MSTTTTITTDTPAQLPDEHIHNPSSPSHGTHHLVDVVLKELMPRLEKEPSVELLRKIHLRLDHVLDLEPVLILDRSEDRLRVTSNLRILPDETKILDVMFEDKDGAITNALVRIEDRDSWTLDLEELFEGSPRWRNFAGDTDSLEELTGFLNVRKEAYLKWKQTVRRKVSDYVKSRSVRLFGEKWIRVKIAKLDTLEPSLLDEIDIERELVRSVMDTPGFSVCEIGCLIALRVAWILSKKIKAMRNGAFKIGPVWIYETEGEEEETIAELEKHAPWYSPSGVNELLACLTGIDVYGTNEQIVELVSQKEIVLLDHIAAPDLFVLKEFQGDNVAVGHIAAQLEEEHVNLIRARAEVITKTRDARREEDARRKRELDAIEKKTNEARLLPGSRLSPKSRPLPGSRLLPGLRLLPGSRLLPELRPLPGLRLVPGSRLSQKGLVTFEGDKPLYKESKSDTASLWKSTQRSGDCLPVTEHCQGLC